MCHLRLQRRLFTLLTFVVAFVHNASGQNVDSLRRIITTSSTPDSSKVFAYATLGKLYHEVNVDSAVYFANQGLELATRKHFNKGAGGCLNVLAFAYMKRNEGRKALDYYRQAIAEFDAAGYSYGKIKAILSIGDVYYREAKYDTALKYYQDGKKLSDENGDIVHAGHALLSMGGLNIDLGNYNEALRFYLEALKAFEKIDDKQSISMALTNIANVYSSIGDHGKAIAYINKGIELSKQARNKESLLFNLTNAGIVYSEMKDFKNALPYFEKADLIADTLKDINWMAVCKTNLGDVYYGLGVKEKSLGYYREAIKLAGNLDDALFITSTNSGIGKILVEKGEFKEGIKHLNTAFKIAQEKNMKEDISNIARYLSTAYEQTHDLVASLKSHKLYADYKDSVFNEKSNKRIQQLQHDHDLVKKENRIQLLEKNKEIAQANEKNHRMALWALSGGILLLATISLLLYRSRRIAINNRNMILKQKEEIQEQAARLESLNQFKDKTFSVLSHDLRSPINSFTTTMMLLDEDFITPEQLLALKPAMQKQLYSLNNLLDGLLKWATNYMQGQGPAQPEYTNLTQITQQCVSLLQKEADSKKIKIVNELPEELNAYCDPGQMDIVIRNLMVNAIKFTHADGTIKLQASNREEGVRFTISDTGVGMNKQQLDTLFMPVGERNTYGTEGERGLGLGLLLCHEFIKANNGVISVTSEEGKGSVFTVTLPGQLN